MNKDDEKKDDDATLKEMLIDAYRRGKIAGRNELYEKIKARRNAPLSVNENVWKSLS